MKELEEKIEENALPDEFEKMEQFIGKEIQGVY